MLIFFMNILFIQNINMISALESQSSNENVGRRSRRRPRNTGHSSNLIHVKNDNLITQKNCL